jgi:hypothetical protein
MANTTFSGPVRSENGFNLVSKDANTGVVHDRTLNGDAVRDTRRYYLYEGFKQRPALNAVATAPLTDADATAAANDAIIIARGIANRDFEVLGTNMTTALCTFNATAAGIILTTAGADADQAIVAPHLDTNQTAWQVTEWGTENQVEWECSLNTNAIDNQKLWAGLKLTNDQLVATDANQAFFKFQTDATNSEAFTDYTLLHFVYSVADTDYISALPVTVAANTIYHLKISIDSDRKAAIFVDGVQYNVTTTSGSTGGTAVVAGTTKTAALTDNIDLIPYIGIEAGAAAAEAVDVHYQAISRTIFE